MHQLFCLQTAASSTMCSSAVSTHLYTTHAGFSELRLKTRNLCVEGLGHLEDVQPWETDFDLLRDLRPLPEPRPATPAETLVDWLQVGFLPANALSPRLCETTLSYSYRLPNDAPWPTRARYNHKDRCRY